MLAFVWGLLTAAILAAYPNAQPKPALIIAVLGLACFFCGGLVKSSLFIGGYLWLQYWLDSELARPCHEIFWFLCQADIEAEPGYRFLMGSWLGIWVPEAQARLEALCFAWHPIWGPWALGLLGGRLDASHKNLVDLYRQLGLLHVLVISGSHFSFLSRFSLWLSAGPSRLLYVLRLISFRLWLALHLLLLAGTWLLLAFYALVVGLSPPCQRAFLGGLLQAWVPFVGGRGRQELLVVWTACLQAFLFPLSFLSLSNALSWSAYAVLMHFNQQAAGRSVFLQRELLMALISLAYFGSFSPLGLLLNPLLEPVWNVVLLAAMLGVAGWGIGVNHGLELLHQFLTWMAQLQQELWSSQALAWAQGLDHHARLLCWLLSLCLILGLKRIPLRANA